MSPTFLSVLFVQAKENGHRLKANKRDRDVPDTTHKGSSPLKKNRPSNLQKRNGSSEPFNEEKTDGIVNIALLQALEPEFGLLDKVRPRAPNNSRAQQRSNVNGGQDEGVSYP